MAQKAFLFDMNECTGCRCCVVACQDKNDLEAGFRFRNATDYEGGTFPEVWAATLISACNHCDEPICLANCPATAIFKDEETGLVYKDMELCIGCLTCVQTCPYQHPVNLSYLGKAGKCDGCIDWVQDGMQPACVGACSTRCLKFGDAEAIESEYASKGAVKDLPVLPSSSQTGPNNFIIPKPEMT